MAIERQHINDIEHELSAGLIRTEDRARLMGQLAEARHELVSLQAQAGIVNAKFVDLNVYSPIMARF